MHPNTTHGMYGTREYSSWCAMKKRCTNKNYEYFHRYGGRGIKFCDEWKSFENFYRDMGDRPEDTTLDRIDMDDDYHKDNCRWATSTEQNRNMSTNILITIDDVTQTAIECALDYGLRPSIIYTRYHRGVRGYKLVAPSRNKNQQLNFSEEKNE